MHGPIDADSGIDGLVEKFLVGRFVDRAKIYPSGEIDLLGASRGYAGRFSISNETRG